MTVDTDPTHQGGPLVPRQQPRTDADDSPGVRAILDGLPRATRRRALLIALTVATLLVSAGGVIGATLIRSPEDERAAAEAPPTSTLTAVVERRILASTVVTRGSVRAEREVPVTPTAPSNSTKAVVSALRVATGESVKAGDVPVVVSGRPLIVLPGVVPAYRDLRPGDEGPDVTQLQAALKKLGTYSRGDRSGYFGGATKLAVARLYARIGFKAPTTADGNADAERDRLRAAQTAVEEADRRLQELTLPPTVSTASTADPSQPPTAASAEEIARAKEQLRQARSDLKALRATTGTMVPMAEVAFVPSLPAIVASLQAKVGDPVSEPLITFASGRLGVTAKVQPEQASLLRPGMPVDIISESLGKSASGVVTTIGPLTTDTESGQGSALTYRPVQIRSTKPLGADWNGRDVRLTIKAAQTSGAVLVVPLSAISSGADGMTTVSVMDRDGRLRRIEVRAGASGDGFVEITPISGSVHAGDRVVVGR